MKNRRLSKIGAAIADGVAESFVRIPLDQALYLQTYARLPKVVYTALRLSLLPYNVVLPTYDETTHHKYKDVIPTQMVTIQYNRTLSVEMYVFRRG